MVLYLIAMGLYWAAMLGGRLAFVLPRETGRDFVWHVLLAFLEGFALAASVGLLARSFGLL